MHTFYFHTKDKAEDFANMLCINFKAGGTAIVRPTTPFDGWYVVELMYPTTERQAKAKALWLDLELWPRERGADWDCKQPA